VIDKDGSGILDLSDIMAAYDASKHPEVIAGKKTKNEVFREFLDNFDGGEKDGTVGCAPIIRWTVGFTALFVLRPQVTPEEFERYYATLSASVDSDDYFELMIRNAWHISGGEGWSQNTTCRRVLVTRRDGTQQVVEIKNDIGLGNDLNAIKAALKRQGEEFTVRSVPCFLLAFAPW
jgi:calcyphosin